MLSQNVDFQCYEMNVDLGGTWLVNRYPGCRCDTPAHIYSYSFCPNPQWTNVFAKPPEIHQYLKDTAQKYNCEKLISYGKRIDSAVWNVEAGRWKLKVNDLSTQEEFEDECHVLINATGILNKLKWPNIEGIEQYKGKLVHSANWDATYDFANKRVAVIGIGSSAIQILPEITKTASHATLFAQSSAWITTLSMPRVGYGSRQGQELVDDDLNYLPEVRSRFATDPEYLRLHRIELADGRSESFKALSSGPSHEEELKASYRKSMLDRLGDSPKAKFIARHLIPSFPVGCRRITPGPGFIETLTHQNGNDEQGREVDVIICATGFDYSYVPNFSLVGRDGANIARQWREGPPESYFGTTVTGFPNYFMFIGPNSPVANGGLMQAIQAQGVYIFKCISKLQSQGIRSIEVRQDAMDDYNTHSQAYLRGSVWSGSCSSWYKRGTEDGRIVATYAGSAHHFAEMMRSPRWEDYKYEYESEDDCNEGMTSRPNRFSFLGNGLTRREKLGNSIGATQTLDFGEFWDIMEIPSIYE
ncbi:hypothetical protein ONZ43_g4940 [Nemania bipapillata]|uniref:Uncharacterized protein n=1 Tax=Nemania bipapillata TaxID=110536 RepID=A0ACC2IGG5_9PEZI|nr:hypothetical protein ONZ43_g4940 [Nemania bipapillata]